MPELPEVELCAEKLRAWCVGRAIRGVTALPGPPLRGDTTPELLDAGLRGHTIRAVDRHGKQLVLRTSGPQSLLVHLGMTGSWARSRANARLVLELEDGPVGMEDLRRLGRVRLVSSDAVEQAPEWRGLGPDALAEMARPGRLAARLATAKLPIKVAMMYQGKVAGVGNIYASEACWDARVDPRQEARTLATADFDRLGVAVVAAMERTLAEGRGNPDFRYISDGGQNMFAVYGREAEACPRCGAEIERFEQAGRSTFACTVCQAPPARARKKAAAAGKKKVSKKTAAAGKKKVSHTKAPARAPLAKTSARKAVPKPSSSRAPSPRRGSPPSRAR